VLHDEANFAAENVPLQFADAGQVELVHKLRVDPSLEAFKFGFLLFVREGAP
jgi:hypothetical protein